MLKKLYNPIGNESDIYFQFNKICAYYKKGKGLMELIIMHLIFAGYICAPALIIYD